MIVPIQLAFIIPYSYRTYSLTYYDFLRILLFLEIWIIIKEIGVGNILFCLHIVYFVYINK